MRCDLGFVPNPVIKLLRNSALDYVMILWLSWSFTAAASVFAASVSAATYLAVAAASSKLHPVFSLLTAPLKHERGWQHGLH